MNNLNEEIEETRTGFYNDYNEQTHDTLDDYAASISDDQLLEYDRELPFLKLVHEEIIDSYVDYKRGYEVALYIFEEDYRATGRERPLKKDRVYYGAKLTHLQSGDWCEWTGFSRYDMRTRRITVKEWRKIPEVDQKKKETVSAKKRVFPEQIDKHLKKMTAADFDPKTGALPYCKIVRGPVQQEYARHDFVSWRWDYGWDEEQTGVPEPHPTNPNTGFWTVIFKKYESKYDYEAGHSVDRSHLNEFSVYRTHRSNTEGGKKRKPSVTANVYTMQKRLN
jgi:hypothetical protein|tara:strand:- start:41 stop:877 length:837 start_codon:yes stop_codon:yes gene_type:complete